MISTGHPRLAKRVVVIGPECTGKTDLSKFLATHYKTVFVEEYARAYLNTLIHKYEKSDLTKIAHGQVRMEDERASDARRVLICDTNAIAVKVWSEFKYGDCDPAIQQLVAERIYDLYLLTYIDVPWEDDPLREQPTQREELWLRFVKEIEATKTPYIIIKGPREERRKKSIEAIDTLLKTTSVAHAASDPPPLS